MYVYFTTGTTDFLEKIANKHPDQHMVLMENENHGLLIHETEGNTVFNAPRSYEVIDTAGNLDGGGFIVMNNIPVTDEGRPLFEYRFKNRAGQIEKEPGFTAIRVLRPLKDNTYVILTMWQAEKFFTDWQNSNSFKKAHSKPSGASGEEKQPNIFAGPSFVTKYYLPASAEE